MFKNLKPSRILTAASILLVLTAITVTATRSTQFAFIDSVKEFFGTASVTTPQSTTAPTRLRAVSKTADLFAPATQPMFFNSNVRTPGFTFTWTNPNIITANDDWSLLEGFEGFFLNDGTSTATGVDPQTILGDTYVGTTTVDLDVIANQTATTSTTGGVAEFHTTSQAGGPGLDATIGLQGSNTADAPFIRAYLDTTGYTNVTVAYNVRDIDCTADNAVQAVALQYRVGNSGSYTNVPAGFVADGTTGPSLCTLVTPVSAVLPAAANNQPLVQVRIMTTNAASSDEWVGIDDISVTGTATPTPSISLTPGTGHDFGSVNIDLTSSNTSYAVTGSDLTTTLTCSASSADFEISPNGVNSWSSGVGYTPSGGAVSATFFARFNPNLPGTVNGNVTCSSTGATSVVRNLDGTGFSTLTVNKTGTGTGTVTSGDSAINCGATCSANYTSFVALTHMTATPSPGHTFAGWTGACTGVGACSFQMSANRNLTATFNGPTSSPGDHFRSLATGDWGTPGTWQSSANGTFSDAITATAAPTTAATSVLVRSGHVVTVTADAGSGPLTIAGGGGTVTANSGTTLTVNSSTIFNVQGTINGTGTFATTGNMTLSGLSGTFAAGSNLKVVSGTLTVQNNTIAANITVDAGAVLNTQVGGHTIHHSGNLTNNGTIGGASGTFNISGSGTSFVNNGSMTTQIVTFNAGGTKNFSGTGTLSPTFLQINGGAVANLASNVNIGPTTFQIDASGGGTLTQGGFTATLTGTAFTVNNNGAVSGGTIRMQGTSSVGTAGAASFTSALNINTGTTTFTNSTIVGDITVDNGASFNNNPGGHTINHTGDLTNNGAIGGDGSYHRSPGSPVLSTHG